MKRYLLQFEEGRNKKALFHSKGGGEEEGNLTKAQKGGHWKTAPFTNPDKGKKRKIAALPLIRKNKVNQNFFIYSTAEQKTQKKRGDVKRMGSCRERECYFRGETKRYAYPSATGREGNLHC